MPWLFCHNKHLLGCLVLQLVYFSKHLPGTIWEQGRLKQMPLLLEYLLKSYLEYLFFPFKLWLIHQSVLPTKWRLICVVCNRWRCFIFIKIKLIKLQIICSFTETYMSNISRKHPIKMLLLNCTKLYLGLIRFNKIFLF